MDYLVIPESDGTPYPGNIQPGAYDREGLVALLREHCEDAEAIHFIADMLEE